MFAQSSGPMPLPMRSCLVKARRASIASVMIPIGGGVGVGVEVGPGPLVVSNDERQEAGSKCSLEAEACISLARTLLC